MFVPFVLKHYVDNERDVLRIYKFIRLFIWKIKGQRKKRRKSCLPCNNKVNKEKKGELNNNKF